MVLWILSRNFNCLPCIMILQVGAEFVFRVLGCKSKRITVTHKKTLVRSSQLIVFLLLFFNLLCVL